MELNLIQAVLLSFRDFISSEFGLHFTKDRLDDLQKKLVHFAEKQAFDGDINQLILMLQNSQLYHQQLQEFIESLTIGETYFFREPETLNVVINHILPTLQQSGSREFRIWSAGCATGEEPYSLAMMLDRYQPKFRKFPIHIFATDINRKSLKKAQSGSYKGWSFRNTSPEYLSRYFIKEQDSVYHIHEDLKRRIQFSQLNLASSDFIMQNSALRDLDVIFCRNVLMYFSENTILKIVKQFSELLKPSGWLVISQTECTHYFQPYFDVVQMGDAFLFRKKSHADVVSIKSDSYTDITNPYQLATPLDYSSMQFALTTESTSTFERLTTQEPTVVKTKPETPKTNPVTQARKLADQGDLASALEICTGVLAIHKLDIQAHYLHAMILQEMHQYDEAKQALRRVLFLQPDMLMATYALANLEQKSGKRKEALRHFDNLFRSLSLFDDDDPIPYSDNLSARQLKELLLEFRMGY